MNTRPDYVSVLDPISPAIERVRTILFRPFNLGKWFTIGVCAWLAQLGSGGGGNGSGGPPTGRGTATNGGTDEVRRAFDQAYEYVLANINWILPLAIFAVLLVVTVILVLKWLSSRGQFMFLHCVARNKGEVLVPWRQYQHHGNNLFLFRIVVGILGFLTTAVFIGLGVTVGVMAHQTTGFTVFSILGIVMCSLLALSSAVVFGLILHLTLDFVVPIMYLHGLRCSKAWRLLLTVLSANKGRLVLYLLFQIVINIAIGVLITAVMCVTCCFACCLFKAPYLGAVALLPISTFKRSYSLYYLAQFGSEFNVFPPEPEPAPEPQPEPVAPHAEEPPEPPQVLP